MLIYEVITKLQIGRYRPGGANLIISEKMYPITQAPAAMTALSLGESEGAHHPDDIAEAEQLVEDIDDSGMYIAQPTRPDGAAAGLRSGAKRTVSYETRHC
eukprot:sb/3478555/